MLAEIVEKENKAPGKRVFSWILWELKIIALEVMDPATGKIRVTAKCTDSEGTTQDKTIQEILNLKGLLNNSPHTIEFTPTFV